MKPEELTKLNIGQRVWHEEREQKIFALDANNSIQFFSSVEHFNWCDICADCSLTAPKRKKTITLTRFIALVEPDDFRQTEWRTDHNPSMYRKIVHTETKTVEISDAE